MKVQILTAVLLVAVAGMAVGWLHRSNAMLGERVQEKRIQQQRQLAQQVKAVGVQPADANGRAPIEASDSREHLANLRREVAALEKRAVEHFVANREQTDAPSTNRDPENGMTKLENLRNVGQGTPAAALQTLFWAALSGEEATMARTIGWENGVRPDAQALVDRLPRELRARYPTPEALAALYISRFALDVSAIHISQTEQKDSNNAMLTVKGLTGVDQKLPMHLGPSGWQLMPGRPMLTALTNELGGKKTDQ